MHNLTRASQELFSRTADEQFETLAALAQHCHRQKQDSLGRWHMPELVRPEPEGQRLLLSLGSEGRFALNDWGFSQLCKLAGVGKETVNRLSAETAARVLCETLPGGTAPSGLPRRRGAAGEPPTMKAAKAGKERWRIVLGRR